ncbi:hypothetical protein Tco_1430177, partial [Tanacetum coccineum]
IAKALWVKVIKAFHGQEGGFGLNDNTSNGVWSKIVGSSNYLHSAEILPIDSIRFRQEKDCLISDRLVDNQWTWNWSRSITGARNTTYLNDLINEISHTDFSPELDACCWTIAKDGAFSVSSTRHHIDTHLLPSLDNQTHWDKTLPQSSNHIFFDCVNAKDIWNLVRNWRDIPFPTFTSFEHCKDWFGSWQASNEKIRRLSVIVAASLWWLWRWIDWLKSPLLVFFPYS